MKTILNFILVLLILVACNKTADDQTQRYMIAYNVFSPDSIHPNNYEVMIMKMDGSEKRNLTNHKDVAWTYCAYKDKLFFISDRDTAYRHYFLYEMNPDGENVRKVSDLQLEDSWMSSRKNGEEIIVAGRIGKFVRYQLFTIKSKTGDFNQITNDTSAIYRDPCFSPDGKQIVFAYQKNKRDKTKHEELFIMKDDGSEMKQLTTYPEDNPSAKDFGYKAGPPRWHPTENYITYISKQDGRHNIFAVTPDGSKQWKLTDNKVNEGWHDWSPDGKWLVFDSANKDESQYNIMLMNWETQEVKQLTDSTFLYNQSPIFVEIN